jgi:hypothetical protein
MTRTSKRLIPKRELDEFMSKLMVPKELCRRCGGKEDCIGIAECYPADYFHAVELEITDPTQDEIVRMVLR